ncbi:hypothetical protein AX17_004038 [Amanita inopinata Kibby_2008]|nr:hypothetical protein AX17_004038 [Amanita inopinata Kibby_2008]
MNHHPDLGANTWIPVDCDLYLQERLLPEGTGMEPFRLRQDLIQELTVHVASIKAHLAEDDRLLDVQEVEEIELILKRIEKDGKDIETLPYSKAVFLVREAHLSTILVERLKDIHPRELENRLED